VKKKLILCITIFIGFHFFLLGIESTLPQRISTLEKKLKKVSGIEKIKLLNKIAGLLRSVSAVNSIKRSQEALKLARENNYPEGEALAYNNIAIGHSVLGDLEKGLRFFDKALEIYKRKNDLPGLSKIINNKGIVYRRSGDYKKALESFNEALKIEQKLGNKKAIILGYLNLGNTYSDRSDYKNGLDYLLKALKMSEEIDDKSQSADIMLNIGNIYLELENPLKAIQYHEKTLNTMEEIGDQYGTCNAYICIGLGHQDLKNYPKALDYLQRGVKLARELGDKRGTSYALGSIGSVYDDLGEHEKALSYYQEVDPILKEINDMKQLTSNYIAIGNSYRFLKKYKKSEEYFKLALEMGEKLKINGLDKACFEGFSRLYADQGDFKKALDYYQRFHRKDKEILNEKNNRQINELQARYESEKKAIEISVLKKNNEIQKLRLSNARFIRNASIIGFIMVVIILMLMFKRYLYLFSFWKKQKYIGQYRLLEKIGSGSMGTIFKAHNIVDKSKITAIKILREELFSDEVNKKRFLREAAIIDQLNHHNIIKIYERGESKQALFLAMEFLNGKTLEKKIIEEGQLKIEEGLHILMQIADALAYIHRQNIIHRDLKPANVMLIEKDGDTSYVKLLDFGLAKMELASQLTHSGNFLGTLQYVAPEQVLNSDSTPANDIFSLGVMVYRVLCGKSPFNGESPIDIMRQIINEKPKALCDCRSGIPSQLNDLVKRMMDKDPKNRPTAEEIYTHLKTITSL